MKERACEECGEPCTRVTHPHNLSRFCSEQCRKRAENGRAQEKSRGRAYVPMKDRRCLDCGELLFHGKVAYPETCRKRCDRCIEVEKERWLANAEFRQKEKETEENEKRRKRGLLHDVLPRTRCCRYCGGVIDRTQRGQSRKVTCGKEGCLLLARKDIILRKAYGITYAEWKKMLDEQGGTCAVCGEVPQGKRPLFVDHDHTTGRVRALLCAGCNAAIGHTKENPDTLRKAAEYLEKYKET